MAQLHTYDHRKGVVDGRRNPADGDSGARVGERQCGVRQRLSFSSRYRKVEGPHEQPSGDPWIRTPAKGTGAIEHCGPWVRDGYESIQVNVDPSGCNIVGDAANEPSIGAGPGRSGSLIRLAAKTANQPGTAFHQGLPSGAINTTGEMSV